MILDKPRGERFVAIVDAALEAWAARWPLYVGIALASIGAELCVAALSRYDVFAGVIALCIVDGFATAFVTIDVAERLREQPRSVRDVLHRSLVRWPVVAFVLAIATVIQTSFTPWIFGSAEEMFYGIGILPALVVFGMLGIATVIASIDDSRPLYLLPGHALVRSILFSGVWPNLGRLALAGAMLAVPMMVQVLLGSWLATRGVPSGPNLFWSNIPVDALTLAPFQAFFTYLYFDFVAREQAKR